MLETASKEEFWRDAEELLHVTRIDELDDPVFAQLQVDIDEKLTAGVNGRKINHADLADSGCRRDHLPLQDGLQEVLYPWTLVEDLRASTPSC